MQPIQPCEPAVPKTAPVVLLTRPAVPAARIRQMLGSGVGVILSPVIAIAPVAFSVDLSDYRTLIFTSQHAVKSMHGHAGLVGKQAFVVGEQTAKAASALGLSVVAAVGNAEELVARITSLRPKGQALFVRGVYSRGDIEIRLKNGGLETDSVVTYDQIEQSLSPQAQQILGGKGAVVLPLFSPRSARLMAQKVQECSGSAPLIVIGMSPAELEAWGDLPTDVAVAVDRPTSRAMVQEILRQVRRLT